MRDDADATKRLVLSAQRGDAGAFGELAQLFLRPAYAVALAVVRRPADAEDVAQDALVKALGAIDTCREPGRFLPWLLSIVRNEGRNWLAKRKHRDVPAEDIAEAAGPDDAPLSTRDWLRQALATLNETQREVVLLHDLEGLTHGEIAASLGCSEIMSRQHLFAARRVLRTALAPVRAEAEREAETSHVEE
jgi:RNA polymerase sigma-70 factor (ECF subfamily)